MLGQASEIIPGFLYQGGYNIVFAQRLREMGITLVVNCTLEIPVVQLKGVDSIQVKCNDLPTSEIKQYFGGVADRIEQERIREGRVLVHCMAGISRSSSIVLAYLVKHRKMTLRDAFTLLRSKRPQVRPNVGFWKQLIDFELQITGQASVGMIQSPIGLIPDVYKDEVRGYGSPAMWLSFTNGNAHLDDTNAAEPSEQQQQQQPPGANANANVNVNGNSAANTNVNVKDAARQFETAAMKTPPKQAPLAAGNSPVRYSDTFNRLGFG